MLFRNTKASHKDHTHRGRLAVASAVLGVMFTFQAEAESRAGAFEMLVFEESAAGRYLVDGALEEALALNEARSLKRFSAVNDRCVSLTLAGQLEKARVVCNDAVRAARRSDTRAAGQGVAMDTRSQRAMAYTNRGVLFALLGEVRLAQEDFKSAIDLSTGLTAATDNLDLLENRPAVASID